MAELIYRNVKNLPAVESKDVLNESDALIVVQDTTTKQASFADVRDAIRDAVVDYIDLGPEDVGADPVGSADAALTAAKNYADGKISDLNTALSKEITDNATAIQDLSTNVTNNYVKKTDTIGKATADADGNVITDTYATKEENEKSLADAKEYTDTEITNLIGTAPETLNTLGEIAEALNGDAGIVNTIISQIPTKVSQLNNDTGFITKNADITGTAAKATADADGNVITDTYATKEENGKSLADAKEYTDTEITNLKDGVSEDMNTLAKIAKAVKANADYIANDTDTKVTNTLNTTTKAYVTGTTFDETNTGTQVFDTGVYLDEEAGTLTASKFKGNLEGNANTATKLQTESTISLSGAITGSGAFDGSGNLNIETLVSHSHPYLPLAGGDMTGTISTSKTTGTYLAGNQGEAIINSTADAGSYTMLAKMNSTNGYFTMGMDGANFRLQYTRKSIIDAEINTVSKTLKLLDESGNASFPNILDALIFRGAHYSNSTRFADESFFAGEALETNDLIILDASTRKWFKSTTARTYAGVAMIATANAKCSSGSTVEANVGMCCTVTAATVGSLAAKNLVLIQGTLGDDGISFTTDGTITNTRVEGKEYIRAGYLQSATSIFLSGTNPQILTWGSGGGGSIDPETLEKLVTTDAEQTITGSKTFSGTSYVTGKMQQSGTFTDYTTYRFRNTAMGTSSTPTTDATYGGSGSIYIQYS